MSVSVAVNFKRVAVTAEVEDPDAARRARAAAAAAEAAEAEGAEEGEDEGAAEGDAPAEGEDGKLKQSQWRQLKKNQVSSFLSLSEPEIVYERIPMTQDELLNLRRLIEGAIGFSEARGDLLEVVNVKFVEESLYDETEEDFWEKEYFWNAVKISAAVLLGLIFILAVIRPLITRLMRTDDEDDYDIAGMEDQFADVGASTGDIGESTQYSYSEDGVLQLPQLNKDEERLQIIRALVENEPELAIQVVKMWLEEDSIRG